MTTLGEETLQPRSASDEDGEVLVRVENVSKKFCRSLKRSLWYGLQDAATELTGLKSDHELRTEEFWALENVSFELKRGEALGLVGSNGAGKTTLLRIISGLIRPDRGSVTVKGKVAPLIALGAGFNPILTGRENIYANMSILGLSKDEINDRFEDVVEFAEIGEAIDAPIQSYSSGMAARLGFASAVHTEPDVLLIDEVLAVGDIKFRTKCYRKLAQLLEKKVAFVLVSHDPNAIVSTCEKSVLLLKGKLIESGDSFEILKKYDQTLLQSDKNILEGRFSLKKSNKNTDIGIQSLCFKDKASKIVDSPISGEATELCIGIDARISCHIGITIHIHDQARNGERILNISTFRDKKRIEIDKGIHEIKMAMPFLCLKSGTYSMKVSVSKDSLYIFDAVEGFSFKVSESENDSLQCAFFQPRRWEIS